VTPQVLTFWDLPADSSCAWPDPINVTDSSIIMLPEMQKFLVLSYSWTSCSVSASQAQLSDLQVVAEDWLGI